MLKKKVLVFVGVFLFLGCRVAHADIIINEIMYAPESGSEHEWVEIFNNGSEAVDLDKYRFFHGETNSGPLSLKNGSSTVLDPSSYAVIAKSSMDYSWLPSSGMILSASTLSLPDSGDNTYIAVSDADKNIIDSVKYDTSLGGSKDSKTSLSLINGEWKSGTPTPGTSNQNSTVVNNNQNTTEEKSDTTTVIKSSSSSSSIPSKKENKVIPVFQANILVPSLGFVGQPIDFNLSVKYGDQNYAVGKYYWNFGDGSFLQKSGGFEKFSHTYFYPGEYNVSLEYYKSDGSISKDAGNEVTLKIIPLTVVISKVGDEKDFFVELSNNADHEIDVSKWQLSSLNKIFTLPKNTIILANKFLTIPGRISGFTLGDKNSLKLSSSTGEVVFDYNPVLVENKVSNNSIQEVSTRELTKDNKKEVQNLDVDLPANALMGIRSNDSSNGFLFYGSFLILLVSASMAVYFIRRKKNTLNVEDGSDFEILDE
jgi:hypothetical protein